MGQSAFKSVETNLERINQKLLRDEVPLDVIKEYQKQLDVYSNQLKNVPKRKQKGQEYIRIKSKLEGVSKNLCYKEQQRTEINVIPVNIVRKQTEVFNKNTNETPKIAKHSSQKDFNAAQQKPLKDTKPKQLAETQSVFHREIRNDGIEYEDIENQFLNLIAKFEEISNTDKLHTLTKLKQKLELISNFELEENIKYLLHNIDCNITLITNKTEEQKYKTAQKQNVLNKNKKNYLEYKDLKDQYRKLIDKFDLVSITEKLKALTVLKQQLLQIDDSYIKEKIKHLLNNISNNIIVLEQEKNQANLEMHLLKILNEWINKNEKPSEHLVQILTKINTKYKLFQQKSDTPIVKILDKKNEIEYQPVEKSRPVSKMEEKTFVVANQDDLVNLYNKIHQILIYLNNTEGEKIHFASVQEDLLSHELYLKNLKVPPNLTPTQEKILQYITQSLNILNMKKNALRYNDIYKNSSQPVKETITESKKVEVVEVDKSNRDFDLKKLHNLDLTSQVNTVDQWAHICEEKIQKLTKSSQTMEWFVIEENLESFAEHLDNLKRTNNVDLSQKKIKVKNHINNLFALIDKQKNEFKVAKNNIDKVDSTSKPSKVLIKQLSDLDAKENKQLLEQLKQITIVKQQTKQLDEKMQHLLKANVELADYCILEEELSRLVDHLHKIKCNDHSESAKEKTKLNQYINNLLTLLNKQKETFKNPKYTNKNDSFAEAPKILHLEERFADFDLKKIQKLSTKLEQIQTVNQWAQQLEDEIQNSLDLNESIERFVVEEKLLSLIDCLDTIKCKDNPDVLKEKIQIINYINNLLAILDKPETTFKESRDDYSNNVCVTKL